MKPFGLSLKKMLPKVVGIPTREPVNRQTALVIRPAKWHEKPLPPEEPKKSLLQSLMKENEELKLKSIANHLELAALKKRLAVLERESKSAKKKLHDTIAAIEQKNTNKPGKYDQLIRKSKTLEKLLSIE